MTRMTGIVSVLGAGALLLAACGEDSRVAGNSANTGNAQATGRVFDSKGSPVRGAWVECRPDSLAPWDATLSGWTSLTDSVGRYFCTDLPYGRVGISALDPGSGLSRWRDDTLSPNTKPGPEKSDTLVRPGAIRVALPPESYGTLYLTGLGRSFTVLGEQELEIPTVPAGWTGSVVFARSVTSSSVVESGLRVRSGKSDSAGYTRRSTKIRVDLAGGLSTALYQFPLLVRLDSSWQGFAGALPDGSDLRLTTIAGNPLPITIASFDRVARTAALWTLLDTVAAPGATVDLVLSWGIPVPSASPAAFSTSKNWLAAWPLGDSGDSAFDRLETFPGIQSKTTAVDGPISKASRFDGRSSQIIIPNSETGALARPEGGPFTYSCWVQLTTTGGFRSLMGRGKYGPGLAYQQTGDADYWRAFEYRDTPAGTDFRQAAATKAKWTHLAMTVSGTVITLFVDGIRQTTDSSFNREDAGRKNSMFLIGTSIDTLGLTSTFAHFGGDISEVWVQSVARSTDWIRFAATNQSIASLPAQVVK